MADSWTNSWVAGEERALGFLGAGFRDEAARRARLAKPARAMSAGALAVLDASMREVTWTAAQRRGREALGRGEAVCVVTGQQAGLFLGPLYTIHKVASAVAWARALEAERGRPVVPIFWVQSEDADFEEVRRVAVPRGDGSGDGLVDLALAGEAPGAARVSISERDLSSEITELLEELSVFMNGTAAAEVVALVRRHYREGASLAAAAAGLIAELFGAEGVLVLDPRAGALPEARVVHELAIFHAAEVERALSLRVKELEMAGFSVQVPLRPGVALSCFHPDGAGGARFRLVPPTAGEVDFGLSGGGARRVSAEALWRALEQEPRQLSTTALLRPLLQDLALPTVGYVAGPGEAAYWAELEPLYRLASARLGEEVAMPLLIPRVRVVLTTAGARRLAEGLGVAPSEVGALRARLGRERPEVQAVVARGEAALAALDAFGEEVDKCAQTLGDASLSKSARRNDEQARQGILRVMERARSRALEHDEAEEARVTRLEALLAPRGGPQERCLGFMPFAAAVGVEALVEAVVAAAEAQGEAERSGQARGFEVREVAL